MHYTVTRANPTELADLQYLEAQTAKVGPDPRVKIRGEDGETNWMNLTPAQMLAVQTEAFHQCAEGADRHAEVAHVVIGRVVAAERHAHAADDTNAIQGSGLGHRAACKETKRGNDDTPAPYGSERKGDPWP